jgi:hypothetical protein
MQTINFLTDPNSLTKVDINQVTLSPSKDGSLESSVIKPRRRLGDRKEDDAIGGLIQKTRAIHLETGEDAKVELYFSFFFDRCDWRK